VKDVFAKIIEQTLSAQPPSYQTILELDRKVRAKKLPSNLEGPFYDYDADSPAEYMQRNGIAQLRTICLMYLHRTFFARALLDHPVNPLRSPYAPSFLSAYRCASVVVKNSVRSFHRMPDLCIRWGLLWTHLFSAAVSQFPSEINSILTFAPTIQLTVGYVVARAPACVMAQTAFIELGLAVDLFEKGAAFLPRARSGLVGNLAPMRRTFSLMPSFLGHTQQAEGKGLPGVCSV
jgi:hypothetical protein